MFERSSSGARAQGFAASCTLALLLGCSEEASLPSNQPNDDTTTSDDTSAPDDESDASPDSSEPVEAGLSGTPDTNDAGADGAPTDPGLADAASPDDFDFEDCEQLCDQLTVVGCTGPERECMLQCAVDVTSLAGTRCKALWVDMIECGRADIETNFECDEEGVPVLRADVCLLEQIELIDCVRSGG